MHQYIGVECPVCKNSFQKGEDIVVCPECGAPHHRACYNEIHQCAFDSLHAGGFEWKSPKQPEPEPEESAQAQPEPHREETQQDWRTPQAWSQAASSRVHPYGGFPPGEELGGLSVRDIAHYLGTSTGYYIRSFQMLLKVKKPISWNWAALIFDYHFFFYRKMYKIGALFLAVMLLSNAATMYHLIQNAPALAQALHSGMDEYVAVINAISQSAGSFRLFNVIQSILRVAGAIFANMLYFRQTTSDIHSIRTSEKYQADSMDYYAALSKKGGTNLPAVVLSVLVTVLSILLPAIYVAMIIIA